MRKVVENYLLMSSDLMRPSESPVADLGETGKCYDGDGRYSEDIRALYCRADGVLSAAEPLAVYDDYFAGYGEGPDILRRGFALCKVPDAHYFWLLVNADD